MENARFLPHGSHRVAPIKRAAIALGAFLACALLGGTASALDPSRSIRQYAHDAWNTKDGLPEGAVLALHQTHDGYLWIGTQCCLVRFDGDRFQSFEEGRLGLKQYSFGRDLLETPDGALWSALVGGIARYSGGRFDFYDHTQGLTHPFVYALSPGPGDSLWLGTGGAGVWQLDQGRFTQHAAYQKQPDLPAKVNDLQGDGRGTLWVATDGGVLALGPSTRKFTLADGLPSLVANVLLVDKKKTVWVGTRHGLAHTNPTGGWTALSQDGLGDNDVTALLEDSDENLWIGTRDGSLRRMRGGRDDGMESVLDAFNGGIYALHEDREGSLWVGTGSGLERYRNGAFLTVGRQEGLPNEQIANILVRRAGGLWVLDGTGALWIYEGGQLKPVAPPGTLPGDGMLGLLETEDGSLWVGGASLHRLRDGQWDTYSNPHGDIGVLVADGPSILLTQTLGDGTSTLWHFDGANFIQVPTEVPLAHVQRLHRDRSGRLWISTGGGGLVRISTEGTRVFRAADGLPHDFVYGLEEDASSKDLWVATRGGLARIRGDKIDSLASFPRMPRRSPVHIQADGLGYLWATSDDGIDRLPLDGLNALADGRTAAPSTQKFTTRDGLRTVQVSWRCSAQARTPDGLLAYATTRGLSIVDPRLIRADSAAPTVHLDDLWIGGQRADLTRTAPIHDGRERIEIRFSAPSLTSADDLEFRYRLMGYDQDWVDAHSTRTASYTTVPPGDYVFRVMARRSGSAWNKEEATLEIRIEPRWYETLTARLLLTSSAALLLFGLYRIRVLQLKRSKRTLTEKVGERTAELGREILERRTAEEAVRRLNEELDARVRERTTQLESANHALVRSEQRYSLAAQGANDGLWDWDLNSGQMYFSPRWKAMLGYDVEEIASEPDAWFSRVHPADLPGLRQALDDRLAGPLAHIRYEYRMVHRDGTDRWVLCRGIVVFDEEGLAIRAAGSQTDITAQKRAEADLQQSATHDALTGLPNRLLLLDRLEQAIARSQRAGGGRFAVLVLDLDRFKTINDSLGHLVGDQLLVQIASGIRSCLRDIDTAARLGGDEFAILVADLESDGHANAIAERLQEVLRTPFEVGDRRLFTSTSIGIALSSDAVRCAEDFLRDADTAMYKAKSLGRARHQIFDSGMHEQAVERLFVEGGIRQALERDELVLYYQPVVSLRTGKPTGVEALVRWQHPERGLLGPAAFLSIVEESGLLLEMSEWVIRVACEQVSAWQRELRAPIRVHVNVPPQLLGDSRLVQQIAENLHRTGLSPSALGVELVESSLVDGRPSVLANLTRLRAMGVYIAIDDFGTGYSSLSYLKRLPIDCLKIDRSFTQGIPSDANDTAICSAIIAIARSLNIEVVAEGVETREQAEFLDNNRCMAAQGYYFSRPLPADECLRFFKTRASSYPPQPLEFPISGVQ